jgi:hypothetical protein
MSSITASPRQRRLLALTLVLALPAVVHALGDGPAVAEHMQQEDIDAGLIGFEELFEHGRELFVAKFNHYDGQGRPATTGTGVPRHPEGQPLFIRTSGPDANSCAGCHNDPFVGGAGDNVANVFVLAQALDPVTQSIEPQFSNERNTLGMQGSGAIEMLAREMTAELQARREAGLEQARQSGGAVRVRLRAKRVAFGELFAYPDGSVDGSAIEGVDADLVIRPFHQKGAVVSLREFSNNALNHHHGMQSVERFGVAVTGTDDHDADGVIDELSVGDLTALTVFQAALAVPGQVFPDSHEARRAVLKGERTFAKVGCSGCHRPSLDLDSAYYSEPNPYNPPGNLHPGEVSQSFTFDLTKEGELPRLEPKRQGGARVRAWTDLKRHNLCDAEIRHYCNELVVQAGIPTELFLTRKLWDVGNSGPYGHRGDLTTLTGAIAAHGGEARKSRLAFDALPQGKRDEVIEFLKSLQMLPPGTPSRIVDSSYRPMNPAALAGLIENAP